VSWNGNRCGVGEKGNDKTHPPSPRVEHPAGYPISVIRYQEAVTPEEPGASRQSGRGDRGVDRVLREVDSKPASMRQAPVSPFTKNVNGCGTQNPLTDQSVGHRPLMLSGKVKIPR
jgi:hypothetical protein